MQMVWGFTFDGRSRFMVAGSKAECVVGVQSLMILPRGIVALHGPVVSPQLENSMLAWKCLPWW